ncbi:E3 ubiquitin-protein ligase HECTD3 isoform X2 [Erpetoichthys calabaricus]|uniref:E3 ubiquitin-protein ligase HECTD3 isoform X2 n=1 Tax=Erpetoichthys calabaricus TaxID=27687 RepID=UPI0010A0A413|nr:E3 ubiquitin-protein ligase HECTD3 isoform X2 [Erpetoichthys calabaricus]
MSLGNNPHILLGRIRFLNECIETFRNSKPPPEALCYVPKEVCYKVCKDSSSTASSAATSAASSAGSGCSAGNTLISVWESPTNSLQTKKLFRFNIEAKKGTCIKATGDQYCNNYGLWVKLNKEQLQEHKSDVDVEEGWILVCKHTEGGSRLVPVESPERVQRQQQLFGYDFKPCSRWDQVVDSKYCLHLGSRPKVAEQDESAINKFRYIPPTWTFECDEDLVHFFYDHIGKEDENLGSVKQYVESIDVSSCSDPNSGSWCLTDGDNDTYWESDGAQGQHWIRLHMKKGTVVKKLILTVDSTDDNYLPRRITVYGGDGDNMKKLSDVGIDESLIGDICVLEDMTGHMPIIEIRIVECKDEGIDVRIRGLKIKSSGERDLGLNADMFQSPHLVRYPRLEGTDPDVLYRRAFVIKRFAFLLDELLPHLVPAWDYTLGTFNQLKYVKQFLLLSKRRAALIMQCLKNSETSKPNFMPRLYINRRLAMEHRDNPSLDPSCKNSVFSQVYEGLKPTDKYEKTLDYRWPVRYDQWWECKFISEGIIDQGGGFRDSLADMSEELCPSSAECPVPLPFFTRTSNQCAGEGRDRYVPNPSCKEFHKYEWIGQLMGAALRGKEFLVLALPGIVWKRLTGETVSWNKDFPAVDSVLVKLLESMESMDKETFEFKFGEELTYTTQLSDGRVVDLKPGGETMVVQYEDRKEFIQLVQKARLEESCEQIAAIQRGLMKVVPQAVLDLLTWQELEKKVCGDPEITVEALKRLTRYEDLGQTDARVQYLWEALTNFTNEDRSRFLRFVTGRSRLPAPIYIFPDKQGNETSDALPQSSTCSSTLFLPNYPSAKVCEEKLRYAAYNCVAIDTDMSPWEE